MGLLDNSSVSGGPPSTPVIGDPTQNVGGWAGGAIRAIGMPPPAAPPFDPMAPGANAGTGQPPSVVQPWTNQQPPTPNAPVITAPAVSLTPALTSNEVNQIIDPNSPLMQRAAAVANEASNDKGLLNSSMAVGAAQNAVLAEAVPIAEQNAQAKNAMTTTQAQINQQTSMANMAAQNNEIMANLDQANKLQLAGMNTQYQSFLNTNNNASSLYNTTMQDISAIQNNSNMDAATKSAAIKQAIEALNGGLSLMSNISGLNLSFHF